MMAKIEWYQEVLTLEPGSKVFFPYARCLAEVGQREEALTILRHGLSLHPEFLEARVFLLALLQEAGECEACAAEMAPVLRLFAAYPAFWEAWSHVAEGKGRLPEALGTGLLAAAFKGEGFSLEGLLLRALRETAGGASGVRRAPNPVQAGERETAHDVRPQASAAASAVAGAEGRETAAGAAAPILPSFIPEEETDEALTLRTRSMADVLAEQGDVREAVAIYRELVLMEKNPDERKSLNKRMKQLEKMISAADAESARSKGSGKGGDGAVQAETGSAPLDGASPDDGVAVQATPTVETGEAGGSGGTQGLRAVLENLAGRLEARARA